MASKRPLSIKKHIEFLKEEMDKKPEEEKASIRLALSLLVRIAQRDYPPPKYDRFI